MADNETLFDKLKSLGVQVGAKNIPAPAPTPVRGGIAPIETVIRGFDLMTPAGPTFITEQHYTGDYAHGSIPLCQTCTIETLAAWGNASRLTNPALHNVVFLDTETTGLAGGTGTLVFLVGVGYHTPDGFHLVQFFMRDPAQEAALMHGLMQWLAPFNVIVTFNGKTFDLPLLYTRCTLNAVNPPFGDWDHLDLLHLARKLWRNRLASRALGDLEKEIVQFTRQGEDIPGWMIPEMYFQYLRNGDAHPLGGVFYHNAIDILSLAALFNHMAELLTEPTRLVAEVPDGGLDVAAVARLYEERGQFEKAAQLYESSLNHGLPEEFFYKTLARYAHMCRKAGQWEEALRLWQRAAEQERNHPLEYEACIELAKYYEHQTRDYSEAMRWVFEAMQRVPYVFRFEYARKDADKELRQRVDRLKKKMGK